MITKTTCGLPEIICILFFSSMLFNNCANVNPLLVDPSYQPNCSSCHGEDLKGLALGPSLLSENLVHGNSVDEIIKGITEGYPSKGMPGFSSGLSESEIQSLAIWIGEQRANTSYADYRFHEQLIIPSPTIESEIHDFNIEVIIDGLDPHPYSIEPLPDGSFLLTEKTIGLSIISPEGTKSELIKSIPKVYDDGGSDGLGVLYGMGWILDVSAHPEYEENGWIYLTHGDRCEDCNLESRDIDQAVSMCRVVRGRIRDGQWVDQEIIWQADVETYTAVVEITVGGRMTFDRAGHLYFSIGGKKYSFEPPGNLELYPGIQDLSLPYGKIYRINDDGSIPSDNPFYEDTNAIKSIWTYGHRSPQGLEYNNHTNQLWQTEMGPRGGDEINYLLPGRNYGWPLYSKGINYDGSKVEYGKYLDIDFDVEDIEQPKVDMTPSPAVSSFVFYEGDKFAQWQNNLIVGSLKAASLYRFVLEGDEITHEEILISNLARIRDIEVGYDGYIYLLLEHSSGGQVVRLVPQPT